MSKISFEIVVKYIDIGITGRTASCSDMVFNTDNYNQAKRYMKYLHLSDVVSVTINKFTVE